MSHRKPSRELLKGAPGVRVAPLVAGAQALRSAYPSRRATGLVK